VFRRMDGYFRPTRSARPSCLALPFGSMYAGARLENGYTNRSRFTRLDDEARRLARSSGNS